MKRVRDLDDDDLWALFNSLESSTKKQLLLSHYDIKDENKEIKVYNDPLLFRDVLQIVVEYIDIQSFGRIKQCCKTFNTKLKEHPKVARVFRAYNEEGYTYDNLYDEYFEVLYNIRKRMIIKLYKLLEIEYINIYSLEYLQNQGKHYIARCEEGYISSNRVFQNKTVMFSIFDENIESFIGDSKIQPLFYTGKPNKCILPVKDLSKKDKKKRRLLLEKHNKFENKLY